MAIQESDHLIAQLRLLDASLIDVNAAGVRFKLAGVFENRGESFESFLAHSVAYCATSVEECDLVSEKSHCV